MKKARADDYDARLARLATLEREPGAQEALRFLAAVLSHQRERYASAPVEAAADAASTDVLAHALAGLFPLLELTGAASAIADEIVPAVDALAPRAPEPLASAGRAVAALDDPQRVALVGAWLDDPALIEPRREAWLRIAAAPILERAASGVEPPGRNEWMGSACPVCGDLAQYSMIVEESGAFMQGAPRYLACRRCSTWWSFARARCPACGEDDTRRISPLYEETRPWVRVDACDTCGTYIKTFDLREPAAVGVVPQVDDVATLALDLWARSQGLERSSHSLAGV